MDSSTFRQPNSVMQDETANDIELASFGNQEATDLAKGGSRSHELAADIAKTSGLHKRTGRSGDAKGVRKKKRNHS